MAYFDGEKIIYYTSEKSVLWPKWDHIDCGCCNGIEWSAGYIPKECKRCGGNGSVFKHRKSGVTAQWPGGPFC